MADSDNSALNALFRQKWEDEKSALMQRAMAAANKAQSWRNFRVGCAVLAYKAGAKPEDQFRIFVGANVKVSQDTRPVCAEMTAILAAFHDDYTHIVGLSVFGKPQDEDDAQSGIRPKHLHPCPDCRKTMAGLAIVYPDTMLLCVKVGVVDSSSQEETQVISTEEMTFKQLLDTHAAGNCTTGK